MHQTGSKTQIADMAAENMIPGLSGAPDACILVVDDDEVICTAAGAVLAESFKVIATLRGSEATGIAAAEKPDLILLDINMDDMDGFEVLRALKEERETRDIPVMFITADEDREKEVQGLKNGALDFIRKPFSPEILIERSRRIITLDRFQKDLQKEIRRQTVKAKRLTREMMEALSHTVDAKDHYTNGHSERVATYSAEIGRRMGKSADEQITLYEVGLLHDIGKIGISEDIISKTSKLTRDEFGEIKEHTVKGYEILRGIVDMPILAKGARSHHERYDGSGYPDGLAGEDIPEVARIIAVADCYDAMTSTRTYSEPRPQADVRAEIARCSGTHFDPVAAAVMLDMIDEDRDFVMNEKAGLGVWKCRSELWDAYEPMAKQEEVPRAEIPAELMESISDIPGIDVRNGVMNCGSPDSYMAVLSTFKKTAAMKADEIEEFFKKGDIGNYTIKVHALKSSARIIGADELSAMARQLELAGKEGDRETIDQKTGDLLEKYRELDRNLSVIESDGDNLKELSPKMRAEAFQSVAEIAQSMDFSMMEEVLKQLKIYRLSPEDKKRVEEIEKRLMSLDWDGVARAAGEA